MATVSTQRPTPDKTPFRYGITPRERAKVQALTGISEPAIKRWERGAKVARATDFALRAAFRQLGLAMPRRAP